MKREILVFTIAIGEYHQKISKFTLPSIKKYAEKIGSDFLIVTEPKKEYITQKWNKFYIHELLNDYKRILYLDCDLIIREDCPNLFNIVPENKLGMFNEERYTSRLEYLLQASEYYKEELPKWDGKFYNSGVMIISRKHKQIFRMPKGIDFVETDQPYINLRIQKDKIDMFDLPYDFNRMDILDKFCGISRLNSYIVHYAGAPKEMIFDVMKKDIKEWKEKYPNFDYKRSIIISVTAGMGDQLCAEPAIRYVEKLYPEANIYVASHWPRLFEHLDLPVFHFNEWKGINDAIITMHTCPDDEQSEHRLSHVLFHPTDYAAISMVKRTMPNYEKTIKLKVDIEDVSYVFDFVRSRGKSNLVLIHPGKWWPSKTFPKEWWQEVIDKISQKYTVGLIGKTIEDDDKTQQGFVDVECPENGVDFRDLTTLGQLIALISMSKCLVTNDSSPLHIAGAFDNWIIVIPTCKHPDHILPYRNGTQYYKTKALYKKLLLDDLEVRHTEFHADTIDKIPEGHTLYEYLPDPDDVVNEVFKIYDEEK